MDIIMKVCAEESKLSLGDLKKKTALFVASMIFRRFTQVYQDSLSSEICYMDLIARKVLEGGVSLTLPEDIEGAEAAVQCGEEYLIKCDRSIGIWKNPSTRIFLKYDRQDKACLYCVQLETDSTDQIEIDGYMKELWEISQNITDSMREELGLKFLVKVTEQNSYTCNLSSSWEKEKNKRKHGEI